MDIKVPALGESVTEATIARWLKKPGENVNLDEPLVELETDKVTLEVNAPATGTLSQNITPQGQPVRVGAIIGQIAPSTGEKTPVSAAAPSSPSPTPPPAPPTIAAPSPVASPAAQQLMAEQNIRPEAVTGTGKGGRITREDIINLSNGESSIKVVPSVGLDPREERQPMSRLRQRIAERLKQAQNTAAILTTFNEIDMSVVMGVRDRYKESFEKKYGVKLGFMSFFVKASVEALQGIPAVNAEIRGSDIIYKKYYDIGIAVGAPTGLIVPVIRDADQKNFAQLEKEIAGYGARAKEGKVTIEEMSGGTFTISNGGTYGSLMSTPILNPPQSAILGMHKIEKRPVVIGGDKIEIRPMMYVALSYDHRIIDGREAVTFLVRIKECLEDPQRLVLEI